MSCQVRIPRRLVGVDRLLAGIRRLTALADAAANRDAIFGRWLASCSSVPGAEEVHIHHLAERSTRTSWWPSTCSPGKGGSAIWSRAPSAPRRELGREHRQQLPRCRRRGIRGQRAAPGRDGRDQLRAAAAARRARRGRGGRDARAPCLGRVRSRQRSSSPARSSSRRRPRWRSCARARRRAPTRSPAA